MAEEFTIAPMRRLLKKFGDLRISDEAAEAMREVIGGLGLKLAKAAVENALNEDRKTVIERDIRFAYKNVIRVEDSY
jgi:histone H3/H4